MPVIVWGIDPDVVNRVPLNGGVNHIRYSLNHEKKLATNYVEVGHLLKVVALDHTHIFSGHISPVPDDSSRFDAGIFELCDKIPDG